MSDSGSIDIANTGATLATSSQENASPSSRERMPVNGLEVIQMLLAKNNVHGIIWNQYSDRDEHVFPNAGLIAANGKRRSLLDGLMRLRQLHIH